MVERVSDEQLNHWADTSEDRLVAKLSADLLATRGRAKRAAAVCGAVLPHGGSWDFAQTILAILTEGRDDH